MRAQRAFGSHTPLSANFEIKCFATKRNQSSGGASGGHDLCGSANPVKFSAMPPHNATGPNGEFRVWFLHGVLRCAWRGADNGASSNIAPTGASAVSIKKLLRNSEEIGLPGRGMNALTKVTENPTPSLWAADMELDCVVFVSALMLTFTLQRERGFFALFFSGVAAPGSKPGEAAFIS